MVSVNYFSSSPPYLNLANNDRRYMVMIFLICNFFLCPTGHGHDFIGDCSVSSLTRLPERGIYVCASLDLLRNARVILICRLSRPRTRNF